MPNYKLFHKGKKCCNHAGLFMYVYKKFDVEPLDLAFVCTKWEGHCVKISQTEPYINPIRSGGGALKAPPPSDFFALTHLILELHYCALVTFPKK